RFMTAIRLPQGLSASFSSVVVVSFALNTLDSATRLLRYSLEEVSDAWCMPLLQNRYISSGFAVGLIALFAFYEVEGQPAALALWTLFGSTNQLLAGLTLLTATIYLRSRSLPFAVVLVPALFMLASTVYAMADNLSGYYQRSQSLLLVV